MSFIHYLSYPVKGPVQVLPGGCIAEPCILRCIGTECGTGDDDNAGPDDLLRKCRLHRDKGIERTLGHGKFQPEIRESFPEEVAADFVLVAHHADRCLVSIV